MVSSDVFHEAHSGTNAAHAGRLSGHRRSLPDDDDNECQRKKGPQNTEQPHIDFFICHPDFFRGPDQQSHAPVEYYLNHRFNTDATGRKRLSLTEEGLRIKAALLSFPRYGAGAGKWWMSCLRTMREHGERVTANRCRYSLARDVIVVRQPHLRSRRITRCVGNIWRAKLDILRPLKRKQ